MKKIIAKELEVGDLFYYNNTYREVVSAKRHRNFHHTYLQVKCIMSANLNKYDNIIEYVDNTDKIGIGTVSFLADHVEVKLLVRDGKEV